MMQQSDHELDALTGGLTRRFREAFNRRDADGLRAVYDGGAISVIEPGTVVRAVGQDHFAGGFDACEAVIRHAYVADDVGLLVADWALSGRGKDGEPVCTEGTSADVARRGLDGQWRCVIDNPFGSGPATATRALGQQLDGQFDEATGNLTGRFREAFNRRDIDTLRGLYERTAASVIKPGRATTGEERAATLDHFFELDTCESVIRHAYVADHIALLVVDWAMSGAVDNGERVRIDGAATDVVRRGSDGQWRYVIDNPFGSGPFDTDEET